MNPQKADNPPKITPRRILSTKEPDTNPTLNDEDYGIIIPEHLKCQKSETTELSKFENVTITVGEPKKVDNGFFSKTFINFLITTNPLKVSVRRKHDDFTWLRERLSIIFNLNVLPRLPKKGKVNNDKHIDKRMRSLERFLNYLLKDPLIKNSNILYDFLTIETDEELEKRKKIYNRMKTPVELKDIKTVDGRIKISVSANKETNEPEKENVEKPKKKKKKVKKKVKEENKIDETIISSTIKNENEEEVNKNYDDILNQKNKEIEELKNKYKENQLIIENKNKEFEEVFKRKKKF